MKSYTEYLIRGCFYLIAGALMLIVAIVLPMSAGWFAVCGGLVMAGGIYFLILYSEKRYAEEQSGNIEK